MLKSFKVEWEGSLQDIEYEDDIPFGDMEYIINQTVDLTDITKPKIKMMEYRLQILNKVIRKAPFNHKDFVVLKNIPSKTMRKILDEVMKDYAMANFLGDWMKSFLGSLEDSEPSTKSTQSAPSPSAGTKPQLTSNQ